MKASLPHLHAETPMGKQGSCKSYLSGDLGGVLPTRDSRICLLVIIVVLWKKARVVGSGVEDSTEGMELFFSGINTQLPCPGWTFLKAPAFSPSWCQVFSFPESPSAIQAHMLTSLWSQTKWLCLLPSPNSSVTWEVRKGDQGKK